ncbi:MAG: DUF1440 domain-containing protein [Chloroflexi bacterium]|nr:DUF1440 domain-containing protein [Chloroflexota bacterium]
MKPKKDSQPQALWFYSTIGGATGTIPMTIFMLVTQRFLPKGQRYELPPELITKELAERAHIRHHMNKTQVLIATLFSHFGYGAAMGVLYGILGRQLPFSSLFRGIVFSLLVWGASYLGLLPLLGISESAHTEPVRRNILMITAHIVWGSTTGIVTDLLDQVSKETS